MARQRSAEALDAQYSAASHAPAGAASGAALLATFYVDRVDPKKADVADRLQELLRRGLSITGIRRDVWHYSPDGKEAFLLRFDPRSHPDATVLQVVLNPSGDTVDDDWEARRRRLEEILEPEALDGIWGYTLVYQANLNPSFGPKEAFAKLRPSARLLYSAQGPYASLAQACLAGVRTWLLTAPTEEGDGAAAGTVYVALSEPEEGSEHETQRDLRKAFLGKGAELLMPELIAHKSYFQRRQYRGSWHEEYKEHLKAFRRIVRSLLDKLDQQEGARDDDVRKLTRRYNELAKMVWILEDVRVSMSRQLRNFDVRLHDYNEWKVTRDNGIFRYHRDYIETTNAELELLVGEGRYALGVADPVLSISRYRAEKATEERRQLEKDKEERRQRRTTVVVAVISAAIGVPGVMNQQATAALLALPPAEWLLDGLFGVRELNLDNDAHTLIVLVAQIVIIAAVAVLLYLVIRRVTGNLGEGRSGHE